MYANDNEMVMGTLSGWLNLGWKWFISVLLALFVGYLFGAATSSGNNEQQPVTVTSTEIAGD